MEFLDDAEFEAYCKHLKRSYLETTIVEGVDLGTLFETSMHEMEVGAEEVHRRFLLCGIDIEQDPRDLAMPLGDPNDRCGVAREKHIIFMSQIPADEDPIAARFMEVDWARGYSGWRRINLEEAHKELSDCGIDIEEWIENGVK